MPLLLRLLNFLEIVKFLNFDLYAHIFCTICGDNYQDPSKTLK